MKLATLSEIADMGISQVIDDAYQPIKNVAGQAVLYGQQLIGDAKQTGGVATGVFAATKTAGGVLGNAALSVAGIEAAVFAIAAASGLFVTSKIILPNLRGLIDELSADPDLKYIELDPTGKYLGLYKTGDKMLSRYVPTAVVNKVFKKMADKKMWGSKGGSPSTGAIIAYNDFLVTMDDYADHVRQYLKTLGNPDYDKIADAIADCMEYAKTKIDNFNAATYTKYPPYIVLQLTDGGTTPGELSIYCPPSPTLNKADFITYSAAMNGTRSDVSYGSVWEAKWYTDNETATGRRQFTFLDIYTPSRIYYGYSYNSHGWAGSSTGALACDNISQGDTQWDGFAISDGFKNGNLSYPTADQTYDDWLTENSLAQSEKITDASDREYTQLNPYVAGMPTTDAQSEQIRTGTIDTTQQEPQQDETQDEITSGTIAIIGNPGTLNPHPPEPNPTPVIPPPSLPAASGLFSIYNPTLAQVKSFSQWLWSSDFIDQILKVFSDPMDAIVGFHYIFAQPQVSGTEHIRVGYLDSGVDSNICSNQYVEIDCGTIDCYEYYGSALDYAPYTKLTLYLPFVGFVDLDTQVYMGGQLNIQIIVDILTGCCIFNIYSIKDGQKRLCDSYSGSCSVQLPYSSGSYLQAVSAITTAAVGGIGGGVPGVAAGVAGAVLGGQVRTQTKQGGSITGNAGSMGVKKPYLIIDRNTPELPVNYNQTQGFPASISGALGDFSGYTRVKDCHLDGIPATDAEKDQIMQLLKNGVIV